MDDPAEAEGRKGGGRVDEVRLLPIVLLAHLPSLIFSVAWLASWFSLLGVGWIDPCDDRGPGNMSELLADDLLRDRMHQSIYNACETLRTMDPPGPKDSGRLYRIAMEKKGIFKAGGVPIEYARYQTDTPGKEPWDHGWTR